MNGMNVLHMKMICVFLTVLFLGGCVVVMVVCCFNFVTHLNVKHVSSTAVKCALQLKWMFLPSIKGEDMHTNNNCAQAEEETRSTVLLILKTHHH